MVLVLALVVSTGGYIITRLSLASTCTVSTTLVNSCRPWLGSRVKGYPQAASDDKSQILYEESKIAGRQNDIAHTFHPAGDDQLSADDKYLATRPNGYLLTNWKPTNKWANVSQNNAGIDKMAASIKSLGSKKIFLALHHEPQNDVTNDPNCPNVSYKGSAGTPTDYRNMWAYVHNRFAQDGVTNVVWVLIYQGYRPFDCLYKDLYPGNSLVDWVAVDDYGTTQHPNFADNIQHSVDLLTADSDSAHNFLSKPWAITEWNFCNSTSSQGISYYNQAKQAIDSGKFSKIKAWVTFDALGTGVTQIPGCLVAYDSNKTYDNARVAAYRAYAQDPVFSGTASTPTPTPIKTPTPTPTPTKTPTPTPTPIKTPTPTPTPSSSNSVTLDTSSDTYVDSASPTVNFGDATALRASNVNNRALLRFQAGNVPSGATIKSVSLKIYVLTDKLTSGGVEVHPSDNSWTAASVTWNTQSPWDNTVLKTSGTPSPGHWLTISLPVSAYNRTGSTNFGLMYTLDNAGFTFASREYNNYGGQGPQLVVTY